MLPKYSTPPPPLPNLNYVPIPMLIDDQLSNNHTNHSPAIFSCSFILSRAVLLFRRTCNYTIKIEKRSSPVKGVQGKHPPPLSSLEMAYDTHFNTRPQTRVTGDETGGDYEVMDEGDRVIYEVIDERREED